MTIELTEQLQHALDISENEHPHLVDPRTKVTYALVPLAELDAMREILEEEPQRHALAKYSLRNALRRAEEDP